MRTTLDKHPSREEIRAHVLRGLHSNIPKCCVIFYVSEWLPRFSTPAMRSHWTRLRRCTRERWAAGAAYIACPECVREGYFRRMHQCTERCADVPGGAHRVRRHKG